MYLVCANVQTYLCSGYLCVSSFSSVETTLRGNTNHFDVEKKSRLHTASSDGTALKISRKTKGLYTSSNTEKNSQNSFSVH